MSHLKTEADRAERIIQRIADACCEDQLPDDVWEAATEAMSAIQNLRHVLSAVSA